MRIRWEAMRIRTQAIGAVSLVGAGEAVRRWRGYRGARYAGAAAALCLLAVAGASAQDARVFYTLTQSGPPVFQYDLRFLNNLDPALFPGYDLYDITIPLDGLTDVTVIERPLGWTEAVSPDAVEFFSFLAGEPPAGTDIAPGVSLGGFTVQSSMSLGGSLFTATFVNPSDPASPVSFGGVIEVAGSAGAPEPSSALLACVGLIGVTVIRRKR